jgi:DNA polymerase III delta prime subunit
MESILKTHIETGNFHHGYLLAGDFEISRKAALEAARVIFQGLPLETNPDFSHQVFELFGIQDSRELRQRASVTSFGEAGKVFIIEIFSFSAESANALLKLFEEPSKGTHFFIIVPSLDDVIPTLRSRLTIIDSADTQKAFDEEKMKFYEKFLKDLPGKRLESIKNIIKDKEKAINFLDELEVILVRALEPPLGGFTAKSAKTKIQALEEIQKCRDFLSSRAGSPKIVLEHLALSLPQIV